MALKLMILLLALVLKHGGCVKRDTNGKPLSLQELTAVDVLIVLAKEPQSVWGAPLSPLKTRSWAAEPSYPALGPSEISVRRGVQRFNNPNDQQGSFGDRPPRV